MKPARSPWLRFFRRRERLEGVMEDEFQAHLELRADDLVRGGLSRKEAAARAREEFGSVEWTKARCREAAGAKRIRRPRMRPLDGALRGLSGASRSLKSSPIVSAMVILSLGLGIGAATAVFSIIGGLLLRTLPVREPERLVHVSYREGTGRNYWATPAAWEEIRARNLFEGAFAWTHERLRMGYDVPRESVEALLASEEFFDVLGVAPALGRSFRGEDQGEVAVLSHSLWRRRFGGDHSVLGQHLSLEGRPYTIIGVTPPGFHGPDVGRTFDVALPIEAAPLPFYRDGERFRIMARLRRAQTPEQATAALLQAQPGIREATLPETWRREYQETYLREPLEAAPAATGVSFLRHRYGGRLLVLLTAIGLVLLIACGNVANLMLARGAGRRRELAVRAALGASRLRLIRQLLAESSLIAALAALSGLVSGLWAGRLLVSQMSTVLEPVFLELPLNGRLLAFTIAAGFGTAAAFGVLPAIRSTGGGPTSWLREQNAATLRSGGLAVIAQVAFSVTIVLVAGWFLGTLSHLAHRQLGFDPDGSLMIDVDLGRSSKAKDPESICEAASSTPGVASAACSAALPIGLRALTAMLDPGTHPFPESERLVHKNVISPGWFQTLKTRLLEGRDFGGPDRAGAVPVAIVNRALAERFLEEGSSLGQMVVEDGGADERVAYQVVGVVEDTVYRSVKEPAPPTLYVPLGQEAHPHPFPFLNVVVRPFEGPPESLATSVTAALQRLDPELLIGVRSMRAQVNATFHQERLLATVAGALGAVALLLSAVGLYGVTAHAVRSGRRDIGVRLAIGASGADVLVAILARLGLLVAAGIAAGWLLGYLTLPFLRSLLFEVDATDPSWFFLAAAMLFATATIAGFVPAWRAVRIDPASVLREL